MAEERAEDAYAYAYGDEVVVEDDGEVDWARRRAARAVCSSESFLPALVLFTLFTPMRHRAAAPLADEGPRMAARRAVVERMVN